MKTLSTGELGLEFGIKSRRILLAVSLVIAAGIEGLHSEVNEHPILGLVPLQLSRARHGQKRFRRLHLTACLFPVPDKAIALGKILLESFGSITKL